MFFSFLKNKCISARNVAKSCLDWNKLKNIRKKKDKEMERKTERLTTPLPWVQQTHFNELKCPSLILRGLEVDRHDAGR